MSRVRRKSQPRRGTSAPRRARKQRGARIMSREHAAMMLPFRASASDPMLSRTAPPRNRPHSIPRGAIASVSEKILPVPWRGAFSARRAAHHFFMRERRCHAPRFTNERCETRRCASRELRTRRHREDAVEAQAQRVAVRLRVFLLDAIVAPREPVADVPLIMPTPRSPRAAATIQRTSVEHAASCAFETSIPVDTPPNHAQRGTEGHRED